MERLRGFAGQNLPSPCLLSIGNFDGVHRGHQAILETMQKSARARSLPTAVLTFEPHPAALLHPDRVPPRLTSADQKAELLRGLGIDFLVEYPTDWALLQLTPEEFYHQIVERRCQARGLVEGPNFFFGKGRSGSVETLENLCRQAGHSLIIVEPLILSGELVSSSRIRRALESGDLSLAEELLGRRYTLQGTVERGAERGRTLGFPTANLGGIRNLLPQPGVYAAWGKTNSGEFPAAVNIGPNPTFGENSVKVEAHLLGYSGDLYGSVLELELIDRLRGLRTFGSVEELQHQISSDVMRTRELCSP